MQGYNFTMAVRAALGNAREEAARLGHEYVGCEHELLGLLDEESSLGVAVIESFGVRPAQLETRVHEIVKRGARGKGRSDLPYTSRAKRVLELAMKEARELHHSYVGTEHLLLGLIGEEQGIAAAVLAEFGIALEAARSRVLELLRAGKQDDSGPRRGNSLAMTRVRRAPDRTPEQAAAFGALAASMIETLAEDGDVAVVFEAHGVDVAALTTALRSIQSPPA